MFERFTKQARAAVRGAAEIARERGAAHVEAEHLLLAVTQGNSAGARALRVCGLDFEALDAALVAETERSLAAVGVAAGTPEFSPFVESPKLATSAKAALAQALRESVARHDRHIGDLHLALAILRPDRGTVARALAIAGFDRESLCTGLGSAP
jgi:ATP-dependent Clp protease ATP-binding subunit ClpA